MTDISGEWKVENEANTRKYELEKSTNGTHFSRIAVRPANNDGNQLYSWLDKNALPGYPYYRIKAVGVNCEYSLTQIVKFLAGNELAAISVYPRTYSPGRYSRRAEVPMKRSNGTGIFARGIY